MNNIAHTDYLRLLEPWVKPFREYCYTPTAREDLLCYGTGYNGWGMQTHQKAFGALAVLAADPHTDSARTGMSKDELLETALRMLRFTLESHEEGSYHCEDGTSWGHTWISVLGVERMVHGVEAIEEHLTAADRELLRKVLVSECDWLMDHYKVVGHPFDNEILRNKPESNLWNGSMLHRTAALYPDAARAEEYREKGTRFLVNSISVASDALSSVVLDGRPVSEWFVGDNFFEESFALNHHGYLNVGYMVICLSNAAMLHFTFKRLGIAPPEALYHHVKELWDTVKPLLFPDGRLIRIGGDTRVRYCYCQDYLLPSLLLAADLFRDEDGPALEAGWLAQVRTEMAANGDGTYLSARCADLKRVSPLYYTRLESDRAVSLSYGAYWRRVFDDLPAGRQENGYKPTVPYAWEDAYHGACLVKGERRLASWTWIAAEGPQGLCLPADGSDLAEWRYNLAGRIQGTGAFNYNHVVAQAHSAFDGGFVTWGKVLACSEELLAEQQSRDVLAVSQTAFAALPDDCTVVGLQYAETVNRSYISSVRGLLLHVPNDVFNGGQRTYDYGRGEELLEGAGSREQRVDTGSRWLNVDGRLGVVQAYGSAPLTLYRPGRRQIGIKHRHQSDAMGMLYADEICSPFCNELEDVPPRTVLVDTGFAVLAGCGRRDTREFAEGGGCTAIAAEGAGGAVRAVLVRGADGNSYLLAANFGGEGASPAVRLSAAAAAIRNLSTSEEIRPSGGAFSLDLAAGAAHLYLVVV